MHHTGPTFRKGGLQVNSFIRYGSVRAHSADGHGRSYAGMPLRLLSAASPTHPLPHTLALAL